LIVQTEAIILHSQRFGDNALIVKALSPSIGLQSYLIPHAYAKGQVKQVGYYFSGSIVELTTYHRPTRELQKITATQLAYSPQSLLTHPIKYCYLQLLVELFSQIIQPEEPNDALYAYCRTTIIELDQQETQLYRWLLGAIAHLCPILGFMPIYEPSSTHNKASNWIFDYQAGKFIQVQTTNDLRGQYLYDVFQQPNWCEKEISLTIPPSARLSTLELVIQYIGHHIGSPIQLKSLAVLQAVFAN
jgi:DNA repair protein RecO (recombination protein O)